MISVVTVTLNPAIDQTLSIPGFAVGQVNRVAESRSDAGGKGVNVASFLSDLGLPVIVTGFLGAGNAGPFENLFHRKRIEDRFVRIAGSTRTGIPPGHESIRSWRHRRRPALRPAWARGPES